MIGLPWHVAEDVDLVVYPALMTLLLDAGRLHFPNEGRVGAEYRSGAPMPLSFRGKQAFAKRLLGAVPAAPIQASIKGLATE